MIGIRHAALAICLALCGCNGSGAVTAAPAASDLARPPVSLGDAAATPVTAANELRLRFDEVLAYRDLKLRWIELEDSRCAIGVTCVWAGQMVATIEVTSGTAAPVEVDVLTLAGREPQETVVAGYALTLLDVSPHPKNNVTPERSAYLLRLGINPL